MNERDITKCEPPPYKKSSKQRKQISDKKVFSFILALVLFFTLFNIAQRMYEKRIFSELKQFSNMPEFTFEDSKKFKEQFASFQIVETDSEYRQSTEVFLSFSTTLDIDYCKSSKEASDIIYLEQRENHIVYSYYDDDFKVIVTKKNFVFGLESLNLSDFLFEQNVYIQNGSNLYHFNKYKLMFSETNFKNEIMDAYEKLSKIKTDN